MFSFKPLNRGVQYPRYGATVHWGAHFLVRFHIMLSHRSLTILVLPWPRCFGSQASQRCSRRLISFDLWRGALLLPLFGAPWTDAKDICVSTLCSDTGSISAFGESLELVLNTITFGKTVNIPRLFLFFPSHPAAEALWVCPAMFDLVLALLFVPTPRYHSTRASGLSPRPIRSYCSDAANSQGREELESTRD